ncbi:MAG: glycosyltransferase family 2 protein [Nitrospira sp.]|jgi:cytoskeletal protein RodZ|nr:MAG: glycosyltransferase family 2 protein [Nitrospira sp.]
MESVGEFFRQVRETKGLTVDEVASKTRIRTDFVKALEEGNFAKLPDQVFARGFVRSYARSLGLDEEDAIHRFIQSAGAFYEKQGERERLRQRQVEEERRRKANRKAVGIAIAVAIVTLIFLLSREQSSTLVRRSGSDAPPPSKKSAPFAKDAREPAPRQELELPPPIAPVAKPAEPMATPPKTLQEKATVSAPATVAKVPVQTEPVPAQSVPSLGSDGPLAGLSVDGPVGSDGPLVLDLDATELSWVVVQVDGGSPQEALLRPGEKAQWKAQDQFTVTLGNAGGVRAELNGKPQKPFGPSGKVVRDVVLKR